MKRLYILLSLTIFLTLSIHGKQFYFKKYQVEKGLSHNTVWCTMQDSYGFMWFGTSDGLNRFDGHTFKVYRNDIQDNFSLGNNSVQTLFEDNERNIWIGTNNGIYIYNRKNDQFSEFNKKTQYGVSISSEVKKIIKTQKGQIWIATLGQGVFIYNIETNTLKQNSQYTAFVWDICEDNTHRIYSSSLQEGLICYDQNGKYIESFAAFSDKKHKGDLKINCIQAIGQRIWFSIGINNLSFLNSKTKQITYYSSDSQNIGTIRTIAEYNDQELLVGSDNGLYIFDIQNEKFSRIDNPLDSRSLSDQSIYTIYKDTEGGFWISTYLGGVNYMAQQNNIFEYYSPTYDLSSTTGKVVSQFCEDKDGSIWIGSQDGLKLLNRKAQKPEPYIIPGKTQKLDIRSLLLDGDDLWIGTFSEGLKVVDTKTNALREYYHARESAQTICSNDILSLFKTSSGDIYIGTTWGLCKYNKDLNNFTTLNFVGTTISVFDILEDNDGYLWVATYNSGVFRFNPLNNKWRHYSHEEKITNSITSNSIITLFEDSNNRIWFGTNGGGMCYYNKETDSFVDFDPLNQILPNKVIYSIEEDNLGNFWISSNAGLLRIHPADMTSRRLFTQEDGLQSNQFNFKASLKSNTGKLFFGGINGFNAFYPNDFKENTYIPPVYITDIRLYNTDANKSKELLNLSEPVYIGKQITLSFDNNSLVFEFEALSYEEPNRNKYKYMLEGFDKDWVNSENLNIASYTNLSPGEYTFRVKGTNNDGKWNEQEASIEVIILPPWWRSSIAYFIYFLCFLAGLYFITIYLINKSNKKFQKQLEEYQIEKEKEVYQSKISFFINLVHEIRTPLSLIKLPLEKLTERNNENIKAIKYLGIIDKNVNYLLNVVNQLLDFQKVENQDKKLNLRQENLNELLQHIYEQFEHSAELKNIELRISLPSDAIISPVDKEKITKIIINLLSNAIKFTQTKILIELHATKELIKINIMDDGEGIPNIEKDKIFKAFYQLNGGHSTGTGIGLAFSKLLAEQHNGTISILDNDWGGSSFILSIPTTYNEMDLPKAEFTKDIVDFIDYSDTDKENPFTKCKVLLVEDNQDLLNMIEDSLNPYFTILKSENGKKALDIISKESIDLIVSDVMMPEMNGLELSKIVKSDINYSHIPIVLLTAKATLDSKIEGLEYGADVYIEKPFSIKHLQKQIENLLKLRIAYQKIVAKYPLSEIASTSLLKKDKEFIEKLHIEIEKHIAELDFSIDNISETMFMSRSSFYRKIKSITGMSPNDYLKVFRLNKAAELILQGDYPIAEICDHVAFSSASYFAKCFKAQFGILPKDYTAEKLKEHSSNNNSAQSTLLIEAYK